jgi:beta-N-acetylhexosaminidase
MVGLPGPVLDRDTARRLTRIGPGGVILFDRNLESPTQTAGLLEQLRSRAARPLLLALDQEGGRVSRLQAWIGSTPSAVALARAGEDTVFRFGRATARALRALGFTVDFAPVVDLCAGDVANGIGDRSFGTDPERVCLLAGAFLEALQGAGVAGCLKHFPGLGPTNLDSHVGLPTAERSRDELERLDLVPYRRLGGRAACVMVGHAAYPALDPDPRRPASLSPPVVTGLLRGSLRFGGLVVSDDLEMGAVAPIDEDGRAAVRAVAAGCDLVLYCASLERAERAADALARAAEEDPLFRGRVAQAESSVDATVARWSAGPGEPAAWDTALEEFERFDKIV